MNDHRRHAITPDQAERNLQRTFAKQQERRERLSVANHQKGDRGPKKMPKRGHERVLQEVLDSESKSIDFFAPRLNCARWVRARLIDFDKFSLVLKDANDTTVCLFKHELSLFRQAKPGANAIDLADVDFESFWAESEVV
jgi:hypothetical protein